MCGPQAKPGLVSASAFSFLFVLYTKRLRKRKRIVFCDMWKLHEIVFLGLSQAHSRSYYLQRFHTAAVGPSGPEKDHGAHKAHRNYCPAFQGEKLCWSLDWKPYQGFSNNLRENRFWLFIKIYNYKMSLDFRNSKWEKQKVCESREMVVARFPNTMQIFQGSRTRFRKNPCTQGVELDKGIV